MVIVTFGMAIISFSMEASFGLKQELEGNGPFYHHLYMTHISIFVYTQIYLPPPSLSHTHTKMLDLGCSIQATI